MGRVGLSFFLDSCKNRVKDKVVQKERVVSYILKDRELISVIEIDV